MSTNPPFLTLNMTKLKLFLRLIFGKTQFSLLSIHIREILISLISVDIQISQKHRSRKFPEANQYFLKNTTT